MLANQRHASETPFKWRFAGGAMMAPLTEKKRCQSWTPSDKTFWIRVWCSQSTSQLQLARFHTVGVVITPSVTKARLILLLCIDKCRVTEWVTSGLPRMSSLQKLWTLQ